MYYTYPKQSMQKLEILRTCWTKQIQCICLTFPMVLQISYKVLNLCWMNECQSSRISVKKYWYFFLFFHENICCGYSWKVPQWGTSHEYPQHMFLWRSKKNILWIPSLITGVVECQYVGQSKSLLSTLCLEDICSLEKAQRVLIFVIFS